MATTREIAEEVLTLLQNEGVNIESATVVDDTSEVASIVAVGSSGDIVRITPATFNKGEDANLQKIEAETARAEAAEAAISENLSSEINRSTAAEEQLQANITAEETRAKSAEKEITELFNAQRKYLFINEQSAITNTGILKSSELSDFITTDFLLLPKGELKISGYDGGSQFNYKICGFFDEGRNFISAYETGESSAGIREVTIDESEYPEGAVYFVVEGRISLISKCFVVYKEKDVTSYIAYADNKAVGINEHLSNLYYSKYGKDGVYSYTDVELTLETVGDYVELRMKYYGNNDAISDKLYIVGLNLNAFGFYTISSNTMWLRVGAGDSWLNFNLPNSFDIKEWHTYKLVKSSTGFDLYIDNTLADSVTYSGTNIFNIKRIGSSSDYPMSIDIDYVNIRSNGKDYNYRGLFANINSTNVEPVMWNIELLQNSIDSEVSRAMAAEEELRIQLSENDYKPCYVSYDAIKKTFTVYQRIADTNKYIGLTVYFFSSRGTMNDEVLWLHLWRIDSGSIYELVEGSMVDTNTSLIVSGGESECVIKRSANSLDFTGGIHGDETIDADGCFVRFYADGILLDTSSSFSLQPCREASYIQKSYLHNTGEYVYNAKTNVPTSSGSGVLSLTTDYNFAIDGVDTGYKAYKSDGVYTTIEAAVAGLSLAVTASDDNFWVLSKVVDIDEEHKKIAVHLKKTEFANQGYTTENTLIFTEEAEDKEYFWYHGICCLDKASATVGHNENYEDVVFTGSTQNYLEHKEYSLFEAYNAENLLSARISSKINNSNLFADKECSMFIWDRLNDSKYYRKTPNFTPIADERMQSVMSVRWSKAV